MRLLRWLSSIVIIVIVLVIVAVLLIYSGIYNVAASYPDNTVVAWILDTTMEHSVKRHSARIKVPALDAPEMAKAGFAHYNQLCVPCHGAPGVEIGDIGKGLTPSPPALTEAAGDWEPNELFWLTKYGVRMTGMPAWGATRSDAEIWDVVALTRRLPSMSEDEYKALGRGKM